MLVLSTLKKLERYGLKWISISCLECCSGLNGIIGASSLRFFYELILHSIRQRYLPNDFSSSLHCEDASVFVENLSNLLRIVCNSTAEFSNLIIKYLF